MSEPNQIFDRPAVRLHRARAAAMPSDLRAIDLEIRRRLIERLDEVKRRFARVLDLNCGDGSLASMLVESGREPSFIATLDRTPGFARTPRSTVGDPEFLPFASESFDLVVAALALHWCDDLPGALWQIRRTLVNDGLFLATIWGGDTLSELRWALGEAELQESGGVSPRISPFTDVRDAGSLLQRAGFALPVVDSEILTVSYPHVPALVRDLRAMGETNAVLARRRRFTGRRVMLRAMELYTQRFGDAAGRIPATFQVLTLTGWAPDPGQPKPLPRGSAKVSLVDALLGRKDDPLQMSRGEES